MTIKGNGINVMAQFYDKIYKSNKLYIIWMKMQEIKNW